MEGGETERLVNWSRWQPHEACWREGRLPRVPGLYRIRRAGRADVDYIGQTGLTLRQRQGMLSGVYAEKMPYRDPHTAGPALWALRHATGCAFEVAVALLRNDVLPFYAERGIPVGAILTDKGREFCGTDTHPSELYLALSDVEHRRAKVRSPQTNGFVERFHCTIQMEFFQVALRQRFYASADGLQPDLDTWLVHYNTERPHHGYRNRGKRPMDTVNDYLTLVRQEG